MDRLELLAQIREILGKAGFYVSDAYAIRLPGFDIVARRDETLLIIKALTNIDAISEEGAKQLRTLSFLLKATPLLIGEKNGLNSLEDEVVYLRFGIQAVTLSTLRNTILDDVPVNIYAAPGGLYVNLNKEKIQRLRQEKNISLGEFARFVRVSRRTVRMYEEGMSARIDIASRIEELLSSSITSPINLLRHPILETDILPLYQQGRREQKDLQEEVFSLLHNVGYSIIPMERGPFDAVSKEKDKILLTCVQEYNQKLVKKAQVASSISKITEKHAVVFTDKDHTKKNVEGTPIIAKKELKKIRDPEDVFTLILERMLSE